MQMRIELPDDVHEYLIVEQAKKKVEKRSGFFSLPQTLIRCLVEQMEAKGFKVQPVADDPQT